MDLTPVGLRDAPLDIWGGGVVDFLLFAIFFLPIGLYFPIGPRPTKNIVMIDYNIDP